MYSLAHVQKISFLQMKFPQFHFYYISMCQVSLHFTVLLAVYYQTSSYSLHNSLLTETAVHRYPVEKLFLIFVTFTGNHPW